MGEERGEVEEEVGEELAVVGGRLTGEVSSVAYFTWTSADSGIVQFEGSCMKKYLDATLCMRPDTSKYLVIMNANKCRWSHTHKCTCIGMDAYIQARNYTHTH